MDALTADFTTDDITTNQPAPGLSRIFIKRLLQNLARTLPVNAETDPEGFAEEWEAARELFWSMQPRNPVEAALAARAVACHYRGIDMFARAAQPGISDEKAQRLSANALAAERSFDAALRSLEKRQGKPLPATLPDADAETIRNEPPTQRAPAPPQAPPPARPGAIPHHPLQHPRHITNETHRTASGLATPHAPLPAQPVAAAAT